MNSKRILKRIFIGGGLFFLISVSTVLIVATKNEACLAIQSMLLIYSYFLLAVAIAYFFCLYDVKYTDEAICYMWGKYVYRIVSYDSIRGIVICKAMHYRGGPVTDKDKKYKASLDVYFGSTEEFRSYLHANSITYTKNFICKDNLQKLLLHTSKDIYVTEEIYNIHQKMLSEVFAESPTRLLIACGGRYTKFVNMTEYNPGEYTAWQ